MPKVFSLQQLETKAMTERLISVGAWGPLRGDENDVLSRYFEAALFVARAPIVRITSDCPLIDVHLVNQVIHKFTIPKLITYPIQ